MSARRYTVLVVEDEVLIRLDICEHLASCGFAVVEAKNAAEAMAILKARGNDIDIVFTDVRMPGAMDGVQLAQWSLKHYPDTPVMVASGDSARAEVLAELCMETFSKPYWPEQISNKIREVLARR